VEPTSLPEGDDALNPAVSLVAFGSLASSTPKHCEADDAFAEIVGRLHSLFDQENEEVVNRLLQREGKRPRFTLGVAIQSDKTAQSRIEGAPLPKGCKSRVLVK